MKEQAEKFVEALMRVFRCRDIGELQAAVQIFPTEENFSVAGEIRGVVQMAGLEGWDEAADTPTAETDMVPVNLWWVYWMFWERRKGSTLKLKLRTPETCAAAWDDVNITGVTFMAACTSATERSSAWANNRWSQHRLDSWRFASPTEWSRHPRTAPERRFRRLDRANGRLGPA